MKIQILVLLLGISLLAPTMAWRRRRRRRCDSSSCLWTWASCSRSCGGGRQAPRITRQRGSCGTCNLPQARTCNNRCCPVNCQWGSWGSWSSCSVSCGGGVSERRRLPSPSAICGGAGCTGSPSATKPCNTGCCPVDCQWGTWGSWGLCSVSCGGGGRSRNRLVSVPERCGGQDCGGPSDQNEKCNSECCAVDCAWGPWGAYGACSTSCGGGIMQKTRRVATPNSCGGLPCYEASSIASPCNQHHCPVDCLWSVWSGWEQCSSSCGGGTQNKTRQMVVSPQYGGKICKEGNTESRVCGTECCPVDCVWENWGEWGKCSSTCGRGSHSRSRAISTSSSCFGSDCDGEFVEERFCNDVCCPVDCVISGWSKWENCSVVCGGGTQTRNRHVIKKAYCGGSECNDVTMENRACNTQCCPVDCRLEEWGLWGDCSASCGPSGFSGRVRSVEREAECGGTDCLEELRELRSCNRICMNGASLVNMTCVCGHGWTGACCERDLDECALKSDNCHLAARCTNTLGGFSCFCGEGFTGNGSSCENINECVTLTHNCDVNAKCTDTGGSYTCKCVDGYTGNGTQCININECDELTHNCAQMAQCVDTEGDYLCSCVAGYSGNGRECFNVDECVTLEHTCHQNAECLDTEGNYTCTCSDGYVGNGFECTNTDECSTQQHDCDTHAKCSDTEGSYECNCLVGYSGTGKECSDIDECLTSQSDCHVQASCANLIGSYKCQCKPGFTGNGRECSNLDECFFATHECDVNAHCVDKHGNYTCVCANGYTGNGFVCSDWDECSTDPCGNNTQCFNVQGSFVCRCVDGFVEDESSGLESLGENTSCSDINECLSGSGSASICHDRADCVNTNGGFNCSCVIGYRGDGFESCVDTNECIDDDICVPHSTCRNTEGSYTCECKEGYTKIDGKCENYNECARDAEICHKDATCTDTQGSYTCSCNEGYVDHGTQCVDMDECGSGTCGENMICENLPGTYRCVCVKAYVFKNGECVKQDQISQSVSHNDNYVNDDVDVFDWRIPVFVVLSLTLVAMMTFLLVRIHKKRSSKYRVALSPFHNHNFTPKFNENGEIRDEDL